MSSHSPLASPSSSELTRSSSCPHCGHGLLFHHEELTNDPGALGVLSYRYCLMCSRRFDESFRAAHAAPCAQTVVNQKDSPHR